MHNLLCEKRFDQRMWNASLYCISNTSMFMANIISLFQRRLLKDTIVPCDNPSPRPKSFSKFSVKGTQYISFPPLKKGFPLEPQLVFCSV